MPRKKVSYWFGDIEVPDENIKFGDLEVGDVFGHIGCYNVSIKKTKNTSMRLADDWIERWQKDTGFELHTVRETYDSEYLVKKLPKKVQSIFQNVHMN